MSEGGTIALVDRAHPSRLGDLVRALRHRWPDVDVFTDVRDLDALPPGSLFVLSPKAEDAELLNLRRQIFADRRFKVVLWCDEATTVALARKAVDFFDWITHRQECPSGPAPFAVRGLRAAFQAEWPVVWRGSERKEDLDEVLRAAFPTEKVLWVNGADPYDRLVEYMSAPDIVVVRVAHARALRRVRWAYAEAKRKGRLILIAPGLDCPGFWPVHDRYEELDDARARLVRAATPGTLAALLDLEPEAIDEICQRLHAGVLAVELIDAAAESLDPAVGLARYVAKESHEGSGRPLMMCENPFVLRSLSKRPNIRSEFVTWLLKPAPSVQRDLGVWAMHATATFADDLARAPDLRARTLEPVLRSDAMPAMTCIALARATHSFGEKGIGARWLLQCPEKHMRAANADLKRRRGLDAKGSRIDRCILGNFLLLTICFVGVIVLEPFVKVVHRHFGDLVAYGPIIFFAAWVILLGLRVYIDRIRTVIDKQHGVSFIFFAEEHEAEILGEMSLAKFDFSETRARSALTTAQLHLGTEHPLYEEVAQFLAQLMLTSGRPREAWDTIKPLLWPDRELPPELALLTARILARTGRAGDAVQVLARLTGQSIAPTSTLLPSPATQPADGEPSLEQLLQCPAGALAKNPDAHLALVDALLAQGRYPEALHVARKAAATFTDDKTPAIAELRARVVDLERRRG